MKKHFTNGVLVLGMGLVALGIFYANSDNGLQVSHEISNQETEGSTNNSDDVGTTKKVSAFNMLNIDYSVKEFEQKFADIREYLHKSKNISNVELYINPEDSDGNHIILVEMYGEYSDAEADLVSELTLVQTIMRTLHTETKASGRSTTEVVVGHVLYDMILLDSKEAIIYIDGELLSTTLDVGLFKSLTDTLSTEELGEILGNRIPLSEQIEYEKSEDSEG